MKKKTFEKSELNVTFFNSEEIIVASSGQDFVPVYSSENDETEIL